MPMFNLPGTPDRYGTSPEIAACRLPGKRDFGMPCSLAAHGEAGGNLPKMRASSGNAFRPLSEKPFIGHVKWLNASLTAGRGRPELAAGTRPPAEIKYDSQLSGHA